MSLKSSLYFGRVLAGLIQFQYFLAFNLVPGFSPAFFLHHLDQICKDALRLTSASSFQLDLPRFAVYFNFGAKWF